MPDIFQGQATGLNSPLIGAFPIEPNDAADLPNHTRQIRVLGAGGALAAIWANGQTRTIPVFAGDVLNWRLVRVLSTVQPANSIDVLVFLGDSNIRGTQLDPQALSFAPSADVQTWDGTAWQAYTPNVSPGYGAAGGVTGMHFGNSDNRWGPEARVIQRWREDHPGRPLRVFKYGAAGSFVTFGAWNSGNAFTAWETGSGGALLGAALNEFNQAMAALVASGLTPRVQIVNINLGVNDASNATAAAAASAGLQAMVTSIKGWSHVTAGTARFYLNRPDTAGAGPSIATVRSQIAAADAAIADAFMIDTDGAAKNIADPIHYSAAGQIAIGSALYAASGKIDPVGTTATGLWGFY